MVLPWFCRTKNHVEVTIIFILQHGFCSTKLARRVEQHGFYTIPTLNVQFQDAIWMCLKNPGWTFITFSSASLSSSRVRLRTFHALSLGGLSHLTIHFVAGPAPSFRTISLRISTFEACLPNSCLAPSIFVAFAFTRTLMLKQFAIENSIITATNGNEPNVENQK